MRSAFPVLHDFMNLVTEYLISSTNYADPIMNFEVFVILIYGFRMVMILIKSRTKYFLSI